MISITPIGRSFLSPPQEKVQTRTVASKVLKNVYKGSTHTKALVLTGKNRKKIVTVILVLEPTLTTFGLVRLPCATFRKTVLDNVSVTLVKIATNICGS